MASKKTKLDPALNVNDPERFTTQALCDQIKPYLRTLGYKELDQFENDDIMSTEITHKLVKGIEDDDCHWTLNVAGADWEDVGDFGPRGVLFMTQDDNVPKGEFDPFSDELRITNLGQIPILLKKFGFAAKKA